MKRWFSHRRNTAALVLAAFVAATFGLGPARADDQTPGVARMSVIEGSGVIIQRGDANESFAAAINAPIMAGDYLSTDDGSRTEVQLDYVNLLRVAPDTQVRFVNLDPDNHVVQLAQGTVDLSVLGQTNANPEIDTPSIGVRSSTPGRYIVSVTNDGTTQVTVRTGQAEIILPDGTQSLTQGTTVYASGAASSPQMNDGDPIPPNSFDSWNAQRDAMIRRALNTNYAGQITGSSDLYSAGQWLNVPQYGEVWTPNEPAGWAPYRDGSWVWQPYYGWTWVSAEPWGWAPYHYGRWFYAAGTGWCWYPGPPAAAYAPPVWQPALVVFIGFGGGAAGGGFGNIGWIPLAPHDVYHPWWGPGYNNTSVTNITNITHVTNVTNVTNITNVYRNAAVTGGVTAVSTQHFNQGVFTHPVPVAQTQLRSAHLITSTIPIVPTTENLKYTSRPVPATAVGRPPNPSLFHGFKATPPPVKSFTQERQQVTTITQKAYPHAVIPGAVTPPPAARPVAPGPARRATPPAAVERPSVPVERPSVPVERPSAQGELRPPATALPAAPARTPSAWDRFATPSHPAATGETRTAPPPAPYRTEPADGTLRTAAPYHTPLPAFVPRTAAPAFVPHTAPPQVVPHTAAPAYVPRTAPPPPSVPHTAPPHPPAAPQHPPPHKPTPVPEK